MKKNGKRPEVDSSERDHQARYQNFFEDSPIGLTEEDFSEVKRYIEFLKGKYKASLQKIFHEHREEIANCKNRLKWINVNRAQLALFGVNSKEEYINHILQHCQEEPFMEVLLALDGGSLFFEREVQIQTPAGEKRFIKARRSILTNSKDDWKKSVVSCVDITELKSTQENLNNTLQELSLLKEKLEAENIYLQQEIKLDHNFDEIISRSDAFKIVLEKIQLVAGTDATVLITGESGTGKELIARAVHSLSKRNSRPLVKVNCASLPSQLIESELFGHEKGAFTGAISQRLGRFELADGGTIFLDEIGELPFELQAKLLRILQEGEFERLGSSKTVEVDIRVIAATNRDLENLIDRKEFRADLFYRLNVFPIYSLPLREHREDIPVLIEYFCKKFSQKLNRKIKTIPKAVLNSLLDYHWPGNVRELENVIERAVIISRTSVLELGEWLPKKQNHFTKVVSVTTTDLTSTLSPYESLEDVERQHIINVMQQSNWKVRGKDGAAEILNLNPTTLEARMKKLGIKRPS